MSANKRTPGPYSITGGSYLGIIAIVNGKRTQIGRAEGCREGRFGRVRF